MNAVNNLNEIFLAKELSEKNLLKHLKNINSLNNFLPSSLKQTLVVLVKQSEKGQKWAELINTDPLPTNEFELTSRGLQLPDGRFMSFKLVVKASQDLTFFNRYKIGFRWV